MNVSDVLTVLSIAIAALSITYSSDRKIWLYKFSKRDWIVCGIWLIVITYLIHFDKFYSTGWYFPQLMRTGNLYPNAQEWAFLLTIVVIGYFVIKLCKKRFPKSSVFADISWLCFWFFYRCVYVFNSVSNSS